MPSLRHIDIHGHINFPEYEDDREEVIRRAQNAGVGITIVGTGLESSRQAVRLAEVHDNVWAIIGIHPTDAHSGKVHEEFASISKMARHPKVVAIGECGLDYFHSSLEDIPFQREIFKMHIALANETDKPLMLHVRNAQHNSKGGSSDIDPTVHNAYQETLAIVRELAKVRANFHFFAGTVQDALAIVAAGNYISFTGVITFARNYDEIIRTIPITHIMSETDCPYVAPVPHRGTRNEPMYVVETVKKIAEIRGEPIDEVAIQLMKNAENFFGMPI